MSTSGSGIAMRFADDNVPEGSVVDAPLLEKDLTVTHDFVVVGSGAAGAVAAHTLAALGFDVGIVEEGPWVKTRTFQETAYKAFRDMFRGAGTEVLEGRSFMPLIQGRCVGGSTVMNSAIAWRTPDDVLADWRDRFGLGNTLTEEDLDPHFSALEADLNAHAVLDEALGENNRIFLEQNSKDGREPRRMHRYETGCEGSGRCMTGCPNGRKHGMSMTYVPWALSKGARLYTRARVDKIECHGGRATKVIAHAVETERHVGRKIALHVGAKYGVFVAASTIQTPNILRRSGFRSSEIGKHFQMHPGHGLAGVFDAPVKMQTGATQGAESIFLRKSDRIKLETISMQPELAAVRIPGVGPKLMKRFADYSHLAVWAFLVRSDAEGVVKQGFGGRDKVVFSTSEEDMRRARKAAALVARGLFDAGAREVWPGLFGLPTVLKSRDEVRAIDEAPLDSRIYSFIATHLFGAARMGPDARSSVVGLDFATHEVPNVYVVDSSVFPTNLGVNPQHSIMAFSRLAAMRVAEKTRRVNAA